jgi:aldehyde:ferredoxin oxidoreductase
LSTKFRIMLGYNNRIAIVDLTRRRVDYSQPSDRLLRSYIGGRGLGAAILYRHGNAVDPLSPESLLCMLVGPGTGSGLPLANRLVFVFRSPQTNTLAWANTGGYIAAALKDGGLDGIVVTGKSDTPVYLHMQGISISIIDAKPLWGVSAIESTSMLQKTYDKARVLAIGPAGEACVPIATVINDKGRASGVRNGIGAVWGSKGLKAIVVDDQPSQRTEPTNQDLFRELIRGSHAKIRASPVINSKTGTMAVHGTAIALESLGRYQALPTCNHKATTHPDFMLMGGLAITEKVLVDRITCTHCSVRCRRVTASDKRFKFHVEGPDYAQLCAFGPNCGVVDVEAVSYMNYLCYELGLDPIEAGNTMAMISEASELGLVANGPAWGDIDRYIELTRQAGMQQGEWSVLGLGAAGAAAKLGFGHLAMSVKGITIQNVDPRPEPAWGLLNATENLGAAAHIWTYGDLVYALNDIGVKPIVNPGSTPVEIAKQVKYKQDLVAALDAMTICAFSSYAYDDADYATALQLLTGESSWNADSFIAAGERIFSLERQYNADCGFGPENDTLPDRFTKEPVHCGQHEGKVCDLQPMLSEYYKLRGWTNGNVDPAQKISADAIDAVL